MVVASFPPITIEPSPSGFVGGSLGGSVLDWRLGPSSHDVAVCADWSVRCVATIPSITSLRSADV